MKTSRYQQLKSELAKLDEQRTATIGKIRALMIEFDITSAELDNASVKPQKVTIREKTKEKVEKAAVVAKKKSIPVAKPPKYRDPASGKTWNGHGMAPFWIAGSANRDEFLIDKPQQTKKPSATKPSKQKPTKTAKAKAEPTATVIEASATT
jgi:DNA-binding protein H-NS